MRLSLSVVSDPDDFSDEGKYVQFLRDCPVELHPHDDGVLVVMESGREFIVEFVVTPSPPPPPA